jgi:hypothetical protein
MVTATTAGAGSRTPREDDSGFKLRRGVGSRGEGGSVVVDLGGDGGGGRGERSAGREAGSGVWGLFCSGSVGGGKIWDLGS